MTHAFDHQQLRAGDRGRGVLAAHGMHEGIDGAVDDEGRRLDVAQPLLAAAGGEDGAELTADAGRIEAAREAAFAACEVERFVLREAADAQDLPVLREPPLVRRQFLLLRA